MLILTRRIGEKIIINGNIEITYLGVQKKQARLGITAPRDISVHRAEIQSRVDSGLTRPEKKEDVI